LGAFKGFGGSLPQQFALVGDTKDVEGREHGMSGVITQTVEK
jgi:hypothetical protein